MDKTIRCSFCGDNTSETAAMVAGPDVYICGHCLVLALACVAAKDGLAKAIVNQLPKDELRDALSATEAFRKQIHQRQKSETRRAKRMALLQEKRAIKNKAPAPPLGATH